MGKKPKMDEHFTQCGSLLIIKENYSFDVTSSLNYTYAANA
jgi:hypothetical protein